MQFFTSVPEQLYCGLPLYLFFHCSRFVKERRNIDGTLGEMQVQKNLVKGMLPCLEDWDQLYDLIYLTSKGGGLGKSAISNERRPNLIELPPPRDAILNSSLTKQEAEETEVVLVGKTPTHWCIQTSVLRRFL